MFSDHRTIRLMKLIASTMLSAVIKRQYSSEQVHSSDATSQSLKFYLMNLQDEDRRRKPNLTILRGHKLSANAALDSRTPAGSNNLPSSLTHATHSATPAMDTTTSDVIQPNVTWHGMAPRSLFPPISHKRDISSANINRPLPVSHSLYMCCVHIVSK